MISTYMLVQVLKADYRGNHRVWLQFDDGVEGEIDLSDKLGGEIFEPLLDPDYFASFELDETLTWPNGADFAPEYLHACVLGSSGRDDTESDSRRDLNPLRTPRDGPKGVRQGQTEGAGAAPQTKPGHEPRG